MKKCVWSIIQFYRNWKAVVEHGGGGGAVRKITNSETTLSWFEVLGALSSIENGPRHAQIQIIFPYSVLAT